METFGAVFSSIHHHFRDDGDVDFVGGHNFHIHKRRTKIHEPEEENLFEDEEDDSDGESVQILRGLVKEFDVKGHEMLEKFVTKNVPIRRLIEENLHGFWGKTAASDEPEDFIGKSNAGEYKDDTSSDRGLNDDMFTSEGAEVKLGRFRVKTVNLAIVKEEEGQ